MKARFFHMIALAAASMLLSVSCGSTSKFVRQNKNEKGILLTSAALDMPAMTAAARYACKKTGLVIGDETTDDSGNILILGTLKSAWQDWGQHVKITIVNNGPQSEVYYFAQPRIKMNVTADVATICDNFLTHVTTYIEAAKEGIDINTVDTGR